MWISKRKYRTLEKRIADLERQVQSQQKENGVDEISILIKTFRPNSLHAQTKVSFQVPYHDWSELALSEEWKAFEKLLQEYRKENNQTHLKAKGY